MGSIDGSVVSEQLNIGFSSSNATYSPRLRQQFNQVLSQFRVDHPEGGQIATNATESNLNSMNITNFPPDGNSERRPKSTVSYPIPGTSTESIQLQKEIELLRTALSRTSTKATQIVLQDENFVSSLCHLFLKNAKSPALEKAFQDESLYDSPICEFLSHKRQMINRVLQSVTCDQLASFVPESILNKTLAERVKSVTARDLINWLASADRLGYKPDDILEDDEIVLPNETSQDLQDTGQLKRIAVMDQGKASLEQEKSKGLTKNKGEYACAAQQIHDLSSTGSQISGAEKQQSKEQLINIVPNRQSPQVQQPELLIKMRAAGNLVSTSNSSNVVNTHVSRVPDNSNILASSRNSSLPTSQTQELVNEADGASSQRSLMSSQHITSPPPQYGQTFTNNLSNYQRPSTLNTSHNELISRSTPRFGPAQLIPTNHNSNVTPRSNTLNLQPVLSLPPPPNPHEAFAALQSEICAIDETYNNEVSKIPAGTHPDQRAAIMNSLLNSAAAKKRELRKSYSSYLSMQKGPEGIRNTPRLESSTQIPHPMANVYRPPNNYPQANSNTTASSRPSSTVLSGIFPGNGILQNHSASVDGNSYSSQPVPNTHSIQNTHPISNAHPIYQTVYQQAQPQQELPRNFKRPRNDSNASDLQAIMRPNQSFNRPLNLHTGHDSNLHISHDTNSNFLNNSAQKLQSPISSGPPNMHSRAPSSAPSNPELSGTIDIT